LIVDVAVTQSLSIFKEDKVAITAAEEG